ncbi:MAG TPA: hypothetical protein VK123_02050 [Candidatus Limnocylindrales bacterium]|nr:hypothetical protein [Candidatus Limnocylindrales bacterium]
MATSPGLRAGARPEEPFTCAIAGEAAKKPSRAQMGTLSRARVDLLVEAGVTP